MARNRLCIVLLAWLATAGALAVQPATPQADGGTARASGAGCERLANQLVLHTKAGRSAARFLPGVDLALTPLCHDFTGDGRLDVAFAIASGGTGGAFAWAVFRRTEQPAGSLGRRFRKIAEPASGSHTGLLRRGRLVVVRNPIYREGDPNCCPTGGELRRYYRVRPRFVRLVAKRRVP